MGISINTSLLSNVFINNQSAEAIAVLGNSKLLEIADIEQSFLLSNKSDAEAILNRVLQEVKARPGSDYAVRLEFNYLPIAVASSCADGSVFNSRYPQQSCLSISVSPHDLPVGNWEPNNYANISQWLDGLSVYDPQHLLYLTDCDNTLWAGDVTDDAVFKAAVEMGLISWKNTQPFTDRPLPKPDMTVLEYYDYLDSIDPFLSYNFPLQAFSGLTLNDMKKAFDYASDHGMLPVPYREMRNLVHTLQTRGVGVGFVSASSFPLVALMLEESGFTDGKAGFGSLAYVEGVDGYVIDPKDPNKKEILLSDLVQAKALTSASQMFEEFGNYIFTFRPSEILNGREGKEVGALSIAQRHAQRLHLSADEIYAAGFSGDNIAPFADLPGFSPRAQGNDQGLVRALPFVTHPLWLNIYRGKLTQTGLDLKNKKSNSDNFYDFVDQNATLHQNVFVVNQLGIARADLANRDQVGSFVPQAIPTDATDVVSDVGL
ncbi:hypothetical protein K1X76_02875 [bacterium]|nr:hypothetical protein [bacterium]